MASKTSKPSMDLTDRQLLNIIQTEFPLAEEPYRAIGQRLDIGEAEVLERIRRLKHWNVVRQIGAIFDTRRLGYRTTLVAFRYPPGLLDRGARRVNRHPGVSHNYAREGAYNLWFTLAVSPTEDLEHTVEQMATETGADRYRIMPTIRFFKIGVNFDMVRNAGAAYRQASYSPDGYGTSSPSSPGLQPGWNQPQPLTELDVAFIREAQEDLPLVPRPFDAMAERLGLTVHGFFQHASDMQRRGLMRRFSAVLYHRKAGFTANAMAVWRVPEEHAVEVGLAMAESPWVTHCYQRPTFPDWPYTHFTMIHAQTRKECEAVARELSQRTGITDYQTLYSTREYKKTRVRYFVEEAEKELMQA